LKKIWLDEYTDNLQKIDALHEKRRKLPKAIDTVKGSAVAPPYTKRHFTITGADRQQADKIDAEIRKLRDMCDAVEHTAGFRPGIKWTNDLVFGRRKLGGILTELGFGPDGCVEWVIIGIGINCAQSAEDFPEEIRDMAGSLAMVTGTMPDRAALAAAMLESLWRMDSILLPHREQLLQSYRRDCITLGREILLVRGDDRCYGLALDIDEAGALVVRFRDGSVNTVNSGEVSVRGMYGYL